MERDSGVSNGRTAGDRISPAEPRQRWRVVFRRLAPGQDEARRDLVADWLDRLAAAGLPLASQGTGRRGQALALGASLPAGMAAERELADLILAERLPVWRVRAAVTATLPGGVDLLELDDVWLGAPPLARSVVGADYLVTVGSDADPGVDVLRRAAETLLAESTIPRIRQKGDREVAYDLRPLIAEIEALEGPPTGLRIRARFDPERGPGRPEEVLGALSDRLGRPVVAASIVRERLLLADDVADQLAFDTADAARRGASDGRSV